jgi:hypothetical protein
LRRAAPPLGSSGDAATLGIMAGYAWGAGRQAIRQQRECRGHDIEARPGAAAAPRLAVPALVWSANPAGLGAIKNQLTNDQGLDLDPRLNVASPYPTAGPMNDLSSAFTKPVAAQRDRGASARAFSPQILLMAA